MIIKKRLALAFFAFIFIFQSCKKEQSNMVCVPTSLQSGVIAFYPFSNGSLNDFSGNNQNLSNTTGAHAAADRSGNSTCAFEFSNYPSSTQFLTTANTSFLNSLSAFSISLWYMAEDSAASMGNPEGLIQRGQGLSCPDRLGQWSVSLYDCRKAVFGRLNSVWDTDLNMNNTCQQEVYARTGSWHHLAATFNGGNNGEMKIYRDGVLQDTQSGTAGCNPAATIQDIGDLFLGKDYTGRIDDVIIYNRVLSSNEVGQLRQMAACCSM